MWTFLSWVTVAEYNSYWEGGTSACAPFLAQVCDNPNKLWCTAQTLKTLIGTKSNRLCLSGQGEPRASPLLSSAEPSFSFCPQLPHHFNPTLGTLPPRPHPPLPSSVSWLFFPLPLFYPATINSAADLIGLGWSRTSARVRHRGRSIALHSWDDV